MRKKLFLILSVGILLFAGCGGNNDMPGMAEEKTEAVRDTEETGRTGDKEPPAAEQERNGRKEKGQAKKKTPKRPKPEKENTEDAETPESQSESQPGQDAGTEPVQDSADAPEPEEPEPEEAQMAEPEEPNPKETQTEQEETAGQEQAVAAAPYSPDSVCSLAVAKCQAGGMVTTTDNLAGLLAEGKITQEEYNSYYPYDGLGYYSVFVETDLNKASTTSGRKLGSEEGIADYIAGMMLLETEPVFYIEYAGVYKLNGTDFYEFRCYR